VKYYIEHNGNTLLEGVCA